jgi:hypothetical protein
MFYQAVVMGYGGLHDVDVFFEDPFLCFTLLFCLARFGDLAFEVLTLLLWGVGFGIYGFL